MKTVLISGGAGFIGSHTADALARQGFKIRILDNLQSEVHAGRWPRYIQNKGYELIRGDVRDKNAWLVALRKVTYVYHLAAYQDQRLDFSKFFTTNTVSSALLYEVIVEKELPVKKVVLASSQFVYGDGQYRCRHTSDKRQATRDKRHVFYPQLRTLQQFKNKQWDIICPHSKPARFIPFREDQRVSPTNSYGLSKYALENLALRLGKTYNIPTTCYRYSIVQGARQSPRNLYSGALRIFVSQALAGVPITVYEDGNETRDFVNVHDVVAANMLALKNPKTNFKIFNVGGGKAHKVINFAREVKAVTGASCEITVGAYRRTDTRHAVSNNSKLKALGWRPRYSTEDAIREYVAWYRKEGFDKTANKTDLRKLKTGITK